MRNNKFLLASYLNCLYACDFILTFAFYVRRVPRAVRASYDICGADVIIICINHLETILADNGLDIFAII